MTEVFEHDADVHFGKVDKELPDWRKDKSLITEEDPDDEELTKTPPDVVVILGFDPKEFSTEKSFKHLPGQHSQQSHGGGGGGGSETSFARLEGRFRTRRDLEAEHERLDGLDFGIRDRFSESQAIDVIRDYSADSSSEINEKLRSGKSAWEAGAGELQELAERELFREAIVYRGLSTDRFENDYAKLDVGATIEHVGFGSTSLSSQEAVKFASRSGKDDVFTVLEIAAKKGVYIERVTSTKEEYEVVKAHGSRYKFLGVDNDTGMITPHMKVPIRVVKLEEI